MDYSFYLFSKLYDLHTEDDREYDVMFVDICVLYNKYLLSEFNNIKKPQYNCIVDFLIDNMINKK